jgi:hypothetical protein
VEDVIKAKRGGVKSVGKKQKLFCHLSVKNVGEK